MSIYIKYNFTGKFGLIGRAIRVREFLFKYCEDNVFFKKKGGGGKIVNIKLCTPQSDYTEWLIALLPANNTGDYDYRCLYVINDSYESLIPLATFSLKAILPDFSTI